MRIAVVTETYPPEINGVATTIARFVEGLRSKGHAIQLVRPLQRATDAACSSPGFSEVLTRGLPIPRYPHLRMGAPAAGTLRELWSRERPDVVHLVTEGPLGWSALRVAQELSLPVCSDFRTNFHAYSKHYGLAWLKTPIVGYLRHFHNRTRLTMVPTDAMRRDLIAQGFDNLLVVARGVDTQLFNPQRRSDELRRAWGAGPGTQVVMHVGRLAPEKNLDVLIAAYRAMHGARPDTVLVLVGDGPARHELQRQWPQVVFAGLRSGVDLAAHYASADVFLFPSVTETFGNVTPEAMASGLAVLAYDYAAAAQLIRSGENGLLAAFDNPGEFIRMAAALAADGGSDRILGRRARTTAHGPGVAAGGGATRVCAPAHGALCHRAVAFACGRCPPG